MTDGKTTDTDHQRCDFERMGLAAPILKTVRDEGYHTATPIQAQAIPTVLAGSDLMGCAQTGTGKTAAFALPTLHRLAANPTERPNKRRPNKPGRRGRHATPTGPAPPVRCLVLAPTRELAAQIQESFSVYGQRTGLRNTVIFGGVGQNPQVRALHAGVDILVATPGRLLDLKNQGHVDLSKVEVLILDEADQMLDMGFLPDLRRIVAAVPKERQTLMFSATMPDEIRRLASHWLRNPQHVKVARVSSPTKQVEQSLYFVESKLKPQLLVHYLQTTACSRTLVFARTKHGADKIAKHLSRSGIHAAAIHGNKSQNARTRALGEFKSDRPPVLVATDIAARGLDVSGVSHVINYELPEVPETYVHRIGRTGRAGATGQAVSFCGGQERGRLKQIERLTRQAIPQRDDHPEYKRSAAPSGGSKSKPASPGNKGGNKRHAGRGPQGENASGDRKPGASAAKNRRRRPFKARAGASTSTSNSTSASTSAVESTTSSESPAKKRRRKPRPGRRERLRAAARK